MADIHHLSEGWIELESDPGLFTLLVEDFGCKGVQVEEIYDLEKPNLVDGPVYGFIFLFKWTSNPAERRARTRNNLNSMTNGDSSATSQKQAGYVEDQEIVNSIFFAQQIIPNSCATHALISVLLNCPTVDLGPVLQRLKEHTDGMEPELKGYAIGNTPELATAHNLHASVHSLPEATNEKISAGTTARSLNQIQRGVALESFHFVSYVRINDQLYELDGLKRGPINHGSIDKGEEWSEKFRTIIKERIDQTKREQNSGEGSDILYNLMAVVPDKRQAFVDKLQKLQSNRHIVLEAIEVMLRPIRLPEPLDCHNYSKYPTSLTYQEGCASVKVETPEPVDKPLTVDTTSGFNPMMNTATYTSPPSTLTQPLSIQTSGISPALSSSSSTDTSSEAGSAFNSPNAGACSTTVIDPNERCHKFVTIKFQPPPPETSGIGDPHRLPTVKPDLSQLTPVTKAKAESATSSGAMNGVKDLVRLLGALQEEIDTCKKNLSDELEKRGKYKIDDVRRTHNYDEFIQTFLLMLAEQDKLPDLLEKGYSTSNGSGNNNLANGVELEAPQSPTEFFAELLAFKDRSDTEGSTPCKRSPRLANGDGLAEFMTRINGHPVNGLQNDHGNVNGDCAPLVNARATRTTTVDARRARPGKRRPANRRAGRRKN